MKSLATLTNLATSLSQNISSANQALMIQFLSDQQRYLIQKYFDNERSYAVNTIGSTSLSLASSPNVGDVAATLATAWSYTSCYQTVNFGDGESRNCQFTKGNTAITWTAPLDGKQYILQNAPLAGDTSALLTSAWSDSTQSLSSRFSDGTTKTVTYTQGSTTISWTGGLSDDVNAVISTFSADTGITTNGVQYYPIAANISKITNNTITVGQLKFTIIPIQTRNEWDRVNFLPYNSDIPQFAFIYNGQLGIFPIPSSTGNILSFNYKTRVPDFSTNFLFSDTSGTAYVAGQTVYDYQKGSVSGTVNTYTVTGLGTSWTTPFPTGDVTKYNLYLVAQPPKGDGIWYPIQSVESDTSLTLAQPLANAIASGASYSIAQIPVLQEDFHDMLVDGALLRYFTDIVKDKDAYTKHKEEYTVRLALLEDYAGTKQVNVDLGGQPPQTNPNLFVYAGQINNSGT